MAPWYGSGSTGRPLRSCSWSCSGYARTARRCCWPSRTWVARPARHGAPCSTTLSSAGCASRSFWLSTAGPGWSRGGLPPGPTQRCTVHKHRNLLVHAPKRLHDEVSADYTDMIYATSPAEIEERRRAFIRKWRLKCKAGAHSLEEAGDRLFTFYPIAGQPIEERAHHQRDRAAS